MNNIIIVRLRNISLGLNIPEISDEQLFQLVSIIQNNIALIRTITIEEINNMISLVQQTMNINILMANIVGEVLI